MKTTPMGRQREGGKEGLRGPACCVWCLQVPLGTWRTTHCLEVPSCFVVSLPGAAVPVLATRGRLPGEREQ